MALLWGARQAAFMSASFCSSSSPPGSPAACPWHRADSWWAAPRAWEREAGVVIRDHQGNPDGVALCQLGRSVGGGAVDGDHPDLAFLDAMLPGHLPQAGGAPGAGSS